MLTNGVQYKFYSDIEQPNRMDEKPFFVFSMDGIRRTDPATLARFGRHEFDIDAILAEAGRLKLESQMRIELEKEFADPSDEFVRLLATRIQPGLRFTAQVKEQLAPVLSASVASLIRDRVNERLTSALNVANPAAELPEGASDDMSVVEDTVITTDDEIAGFRIVQAIAARHVDPKRVVIRDSKSYCGILLDDNNRKSLARLHFNSPTTRYVGTFAGKAETRHAVSALTDLYKLEGEIVARIAELEGGGAAVG